MRYWELLVELDAAATARAAASKHQKIDAARSRKSDASQRYQDALRRAQAGMQNASTQRSDAAARYQSQMKAANDSERAALKR